MIESKHGRFGICSCSSANSLHICRALVGRHRRLGAYLGNWQLLLLCDTALIASVVTAITHNKSTVIQTLHDSRVIYAQEGFDPDTLIFISDHDFLIKHLFQGILYSFFPHG